MISSTLLLKGVNNYNLGVNRHFDQLADLPFTRNDGTYQPFLTAFAVGSEYDFFKIREVSGQFCLYLSFFLSLSLFLIFYLFSSVSFLIVFFFPLAIFLFICQLFLKALLRSYLSHLHSCSFSLFNIVWHLSPCFSTLNTNWLQCNPGHFDLPIPGINELFDFDGRIMLKVSFLILSWRRSYMRESNFFDVPTLCLFFCFFNSLDLQNRTRREEKTESK